MTSVAELQACLAELGRPHILIVGDLILDRYVSGEVARISPEAPIPILSARHNEVRLGGAGNVAANLRAMQSEVEMMAVVGDDGHGRQLKELLAQIGVGTDSIVIDDSRPTIEKTRLMSGVQQMLRVDWEDPTPIRGATQEAVLAHLEGAISRADGVVLSDYGKGALAPAVIERALSLARAKGIPVIVDPKGTDYGRYRGATAITPNKKEAEVALGRKIASLDELPGAADELIAQADLASILITLGPEGIYWRTKDGQSGRVPAQARAVFDVVGAGDTVAAHLVMHLADGLSVENATSLANHAAGIVVGRLGTSSVTRAELAAAIAAQGPHEGKVLDATTLDVVLAEWRSEQKRIVLTNGCFDVLHRGHVDYLRFARSKGDVLLVAVNDDASVKRLKGEGRPVNPCGDRMAVLAALEMVDAVIAFGEDTPESVVRRVTPSVLVKGEDWRDKGVVGREWVEAHGGQVVLAPLVPGRSTTSILERARAGQKDQG